MLSAILVWGSIDGLEVAARTPAEKLLPITTKGFLSVPDLAALDASFSTIGLGKIMDDPQFQPFVEDFRRQLNERFATTYGRLGFNLDDFRSVVAGEVAIGLVQPDDATQKYAVIAVADVEGKDEEVAQLKASIRTSMEKRKAERTVEQVAEIEVTKYEVPIKPGSKKTFQAFIFVHDDQLFATDHAKVLKPLIERLLGKQSPSLAEVKAYRVTIDRCEQEMATFGFEPQIGIFVDPIGYAEVVRDATANTRKRKRTDMTAALKAQGFDAIKGIGGLITLGTEDYEIFGSAYAYAPPIPKAGEEKYKLAARMLAKSVSDPLDVPHWVPTGSSSVARVAWDLKGSFQYIGTMVDEVAGEEGFFEDLLDSLENDPNGPRINIEKDLVAHLGNQVIAFTDATLPVSPTCERMLLAIELTDAEAMEKSIEKALATDPDAAKKIFNGHAIWEIINNDEETPEIQIEGAGDFANLAYEDDFEDDSSALQALWTNAAITVLNGYLLVSSHTDLVMELVERAEDDPAMRDDADYQALVKALEGVGGGSDCLRLFSRTAREFRSSYELLRLGKMPESEGLMGRLLNAALAPSDKNAVREQEIDGSKLPEFSVIQQHLGPLGVFCRPEDEGWYLAAIAVTRENADSSLQGQREAITTAAAETEETEN